MKRSRSSPSQSPPGASKKEKESEMDSQENSPPVPSKSDLPGRNRIAIHSLLTEAPEPSRTASGRPLTFLPQEDLCVKQPFEIYLTYAQALTGRRDELSEIQSTLSEAESLIQDLSSELEKAENAKPRRARIIGPIRTRIQSAQGQQKDASERLESAQTKVSFSENTMLAMRNVLSKFGWQIQHVGNEIRLQPHPDHPSPQ